MSRLSEIGYGCFSGLLLVMFSCTSAPRRKRADNDEPQSQKLEISPGGFPEVMVRFDDTSISCQIDTGSLRSKVPLRGRFKSYRQQVGGESAESEIEIKNVLLGGMNFFDRKVQVKKVRDSIFPSEGDCIVGLDLLSEAVLSFDFKKSEFKIVEEFPPGITGERLGMSSKLHFGVPVQIGESEYAAVWSTGVSMLSVPKVLIEKHKSDFEPIEKGETDLYRTRNVKVAGHVVPLFTSKQYAFPDIGGVNPETPVIGMSLIKNFNWLIDVDGRRWAVY